jgi:hypothetical protein
LAAEGSFDGVEGGGLEEIFVEDFALDRVLQAEFAVAGEGDDTDSFVGDGAAEELGQGDAIDVGEADVDQGGVGAESLGGGDGIVAAAGDLYVVTSIPEGLAQDQGHVRFVVYHEDSHSTSITASTRTGAEINRDNPLL